MVITSANNYIIRVVLLFLFILSGCQSNSGRAHLNRSQEASMVISVNGIPVSKEEYLLHLQPEIAITYNYFYLNYGAQPSKDFWTNAWDGIKPIDYIKNQTNLKFKRIKIIQCLAAEMNVINPFKYQEFLTYWQKENEDRKVRKSAGEVVYGPINVDKRSYYNYLLSNLEIRLRDKLNQEMFTPSENELRTHYGIMKEEQFSYASIMPIEYLLLDESERTKTEVDQMVYEAKNSIQNGISMARYGKGNPHWKYEKVSLFDSVPSYGEENPEARFKKEVLRLKEGEVQVVSVDFQRYLFRLLRPLEISFRTFEHVKDQVLYDYQNQQYNELIKERMAKASVEKNQKEYDKISID